MGDVWPADEPEKSKLIPVTVYDGSREKFKGWCGDIRIELQDHGLDHHMTNKHPPPAGAIGDQASQEDKDNHAMVARRKTNKRKVYTFIYRYLPQKIKEEASGDPYNGNPYLILELARQEYHQVSAATIKELKKKLINFEMLDNESLKGTVGRLNALIKSLNAQSIATTDKEKRDTLIDALVDEEWDSARRSERKKILKNVDRTYLETVTFLTEEEVERKYLNKNRTSTKKKTDEKAELALFVKLEKKYGNGKNGKGGTGTPNTTPGGNKKGKGWGPEDPNKKVKRPPFKCYTCGATDHNRFSASCPEKGKKQTPAGKKAQEDIANYKAKCDAIPEAYPAEVIITPEVNLVEKRKRKCADSGSSANCKKDTGEVTEIRPAASGSALSGVGGVTAITEKGKLEVIPSEEKLTVHIVPRLKRDLLSIFDMADNWETTFVLNNKRMVVLKNEDMPPIPEELVILKGQPEEGIYLVDEDQEEANCVTETPKAVKEKPAACAEEKRDINAIPTADDFDSELGIPDPATAKRKKKKVTKPKEKEIVTFGLPSDGSIIEEDEEIKTLSSPQKELPTENPKRKRRRRVLMRKRERELRLWHMRYGHIEGLWRMIQKQAVTGLPSNYHELFCQDDFCVHCLHGKQKKDDHGPITRTEREIGELFHVDLTHHDTESLGRKRYSMCMVEHKSKVDFCDFLRKKSDAGEALKKMILKFERQTGKSVKIIQCDGALEFIAEGSVMKKWCVDRGMTVRNSSPDVQEENGIAEARNDRRATCATTMRIARQLSEQFYAESERLACILYSHVPKKDEAISGYEMIWNKKPDCELIHPFACHAYAWRSRKKRKKTKNPSKTRPCLYMGPAIDAAGYRLYDPFAKKIFQQANVLFDEYSFGIPELAKRNRGHKKFMECRFDPTDVYNSDSEWSDEADSESPASSGSDENRNVESDGAESPREKSKPRREETVEQEQEELPFAEEDSRGSSPQRELGIPEDIVGIVPEDTPPLIFMPDPNIASTPPKLPPATKMSQAEPRRSTRLLIKEMTKAPPDNHEAQTASIATNGITTDEYDALSLLTAFLAEGKTESHKTPKSHKQAKRGPDHKEWHEAELREIYAHVINGTFVLVEMPKDGTDGKKHVLMKSLWRYCIKTQQNIITNYKARLCADGRFVVVSPDKAFAGTPLATSINTVFGLAAHYGTKVMSGDIPAAYVQAPIPEGDTIYYVTQPEGHVDPKHPDWVWQLKKCLYGIPISGNLWNATFSQFLLEIGMTRCKSDPAVFYM